MRSATKKRTGRDKAYLKWIRSQFCLLCDLMIVGRVFVDAKPYRQETPTEAAHTGERGLSQKAPDREAIPLCKWHHTEGTESYHRLGKAFYTKWGIDRDKLIRTLNERFDNEQR